MARDQRNITIGITVLIVLVLAVGFYMSASTTTASKTSAESPIAATAAVQTPSPK